MAKQPVKVKLFYSGAWNDHTADTRISNEITITRGRANEQEQAGPCQCGLTFLGHRFNPANPTSDLFGLIGRNTPLRIEMGTEHLGAGNSDVTDTTSQVAPSITVPATPGEGIMFSAWMCPDGAATYTVPGTMTAQGAEIADTRISMRVARQLISSAGATGTRTATCSATEDYAALSVFIPGPTSDPTGSIPTALGVAVVDGTAGDWWLVIAGFNSDPATDPFTPLRPPAAPWDTDGGGWIRLADTGSVQIGDAEAEHLRMIAWIKQVKTTDSGHIVALPAMSTVDEQVMLVKRLPGAGVEDWSIRFEGEVASWTPKQSLGGPNIPPIQWVEVTAAGITRRLGQGADPLATAPQRYAERNGAIGFWPLDDPDGSTQARAVIGRPMVHVPAPAPLSGRNAPDYGTGEAAPWLGPSIKGNSDDGQIRAPITGGTSGGWCVDWMYRADRSSGGDQPIAFGVLVRSENLDYRVAWGSDDIDVGILVLNDALSLLGSSIVADVTPLRDGQPHHMRFRAIEASSTNVDLFLDVDGVNAVAVTVNIGVTTTPPAATVGITWNGGTGFTTPASISSLAVWNQPPPGGANVTAAWFGNANETTDQRIARLADEESVPLVLVGDPTLSVPSGPQYPDGFLAQLAEAAETGQSILGDAREQAAVLDRPIESLYNQLPVLELDYDNGEVAPPLDPVIDDQATRNDVTVTGRGGGEHRVTLGTGPLSTQAPPNGVGRVQTSVAVNVASPSQLGDQAGWRLHLGTIGGTRFPQITVDLTTEPAFAEAAGRVDVGDKLTVDNLPATINPDLASLLVQGYTEVIGSHRRLITFNCSPYEPYQIAEVAHADYGIVQSDSATVNIAVNTTATTLQILSNGYPWDDTEEGNFDIIVGGERMTVTDVPVGGGTFPNRIQNLTVVRSVNGIVKAHAVGARVDFFHRSYIGL
jgi:hypothetical protein